MTVELEDSGDHPHPADGQQGMKRAAPYWTSAGSNEAPQEPGFGTFGANQILRMSRLEQLPRPGERVQWPHWTLYSSFGSGKTSAFLRTLTTSGAPAKTIADRIESPVVRRVPKRREHIVLHQQWEGYVERLTPSGFQALLVDLMGGTDEEERTEIDIDEVSEFDRPLIQLGAVFYWSLGYRVRTSGQREGISVLRFRRLPSWTPEELREAEAAAQSTWRLFGWDSAPNIAGLNEDRQTS